MSSFTHRSASEMALSALVRAISHGSPGAIGAGCRARISSRSLTALASLTCCLNQRQASVCAPRVIARRALRPVFAFARGVTPCGCLPGIVHLLRMTLKSHQVPKNAHKKGVLCPAAATCAILRNPSCSSIVQSIAKRKWFFETAQTRWGTEAAVFVPDRRDELPASKPAALTVPVAACKSVGSPLKDIELPSRQRLRRYVRRPTRAHYQPARDYQPTGRATPQTKRRHPTRVKVRNVSMP
jgi:hypothetical protein